MDTQSLPPESVRRAARTASSEMRDSGSAQAKDTSPSASPSSLTLRESLGTVLCVAAVLLLVGWVSCHLLSGIWLAELFTHFRVQLMVVLGLLAAALAAVRHLRWAVGIAAAIAVLGWPVFQLSFPVAQPITESPQLKLLVANVLYQNANFRPFEELIAEERPDLLLVVECTHGWNDRLERLRETYPYQFAEPRSNGWGIALLSKFPLVEPRAVDLAKVDVPAIVTGVEFDGKLLQFVGVHLLSPLTPGRFAERNRQFESLATLVNQRNGPVVVAGDFNATTWSPFLLKFLRTTRLQDSRQGIGIQPSWPEHAAVLRIPIDHVFVSDEVSVHERRLGPSIDSDHFPVISTISLPPGPARQ